ncbi:unnamed protein product [Linum trigynum]|uniref:Uncharacterized protein n=1 Tax=Linum trigynum TaxID=586398 RepID=A0AAV2DAB5_9ROSI
MKPTFMYLVWLVTATAILGQRPQVVVLGSNGDNGAALQTCYEDCFDNHCKPRWRSWTCMDRCIDVCTQLHSDFDKDDESAGPQFAAIQEPQWVSEVCMVAIACMIYISASLVLFFALRRRHRRRRGAASSVAEVADGSLHYKKITL